MMMGAAARSLVVGSLVASLVAAAGCSRPDPPTFVVKTVKVSQIDLAGVSLDVGADVKNPNRFGLTVKEVTARVLLDGKREAGDVTLTKPVELPASGSTSVVVPLRMQWAGIGACASIAAERRDVPYVVEGTVSVAGGPVVVAVPFKANGTLTRAELQSAVGSTLPNLPFLLQKK
jgi:LEA14-like dessication related protein